MNLEDTGILKKEDCVEACLQIATALLLLFLEQGMQVALYCNGIDTISGDPCILEAGGGVRQRNVCLQTLARIDTAKPVQSFSELFAPVCPMHPMRSIPALYHPMPMKTLQHYFCNIRKNTRI